MSVHAYHDALPGYDERQILHDGCSECETRGESVADAIAHLDESNFERAWTRATTWQKGRHDEVGRISMAEISLLRAMWALQVQLERRGVILGSIPGFGDVFTSPPVAS